MRLPGLHSIHWKVFVFHLALLILPLAYISYKVRSSIETSYLHSTEEGMIDTAAVVSELYARLYGQFGADSEKVAAELSRVYSNLNETYEIKARLFGFTRAEVDTRLLVYDPTGRVIFDTKGTATNQDFSKLEDVRQALNGRYGSRWELDKAHQRVNIYSTLPVFVEGKTVGAVSVSKSTNRIRNFISRAVSAVQRLANVFQFRKILVRRGPFRVEDHAAGRIVHEQPRIDFRSRETKQSRLDFVGLVQVRINARQLGRHFLRIGAELSVKSRIQFTHDRGRIDHPFLGRVEITGLDAGSNLVRNISQRQNQQREVKDEHLPMNAVQTRQPHLQLPGPIPDPANRFDEIQFPEFLPQTFHVDVDRKS